MGYTKSKELERIHLKFCKGLLRVRANTCTAAVYGELGRYPLYIQRYVKIIQNWFKIIDSDTIKLRTIYAALDDCIKGRTNRVSNIKHLLNKYEFAHIFDNLHSVDITKFTLKFKLIVIDCFKNKWLHSLENPVLKLYKECKHVLVMKTIKMFYLEACGFTFVD